MGRRQRERKERKISFKIAEKEQIKRRIDKRRKTIAWECLRITTRAIGICLIALLMVLPSAQEYKPKASHANEFGVIETDKGVIKFKLYSEDAPQTVDNFVLLAQRGYYDSLTFHRVEPGFVIQGGDPNGDGTGGESAWGGTFEDELNPETASYKTGYSQGTVAMANSGPNTNGSQFFICLADQPDLPKQYTIFGQVTEGIDVIGKIAKGDIMNKVYIEDK